MICSYHVNCVVKYVRESIGLSWGYAGMSLWLSSGHLLSLMFHWIQPTTPPCRRLNSDIPELPSPSLHLSDLHSHAPTVHLSLQLAHPIITHHFKLNNLNLDTNRSMVRTVNATWWYWPLYPDLNLSLFVFKAHTTQSSDCCVVQTISTTRMRSNIGA